MDFIIPIDNFVDDAIKKLRKMENLERLDIRTHKRDRSVMIEKIQDKYNLYEDGFYKEEFKDLTENELKKLLKSMRKREFPRSNIVRFYKI